MKLLKTLKSLKNLQKSKLAKAVAMSLIVGSGVMGVCGNALAVTVTIENQTVDGDVCAVNINWSELWGNASKGIVNIRNATVSGTVTGGSAGSMSGNAFDNTVNIENSTIKGNVFGGYANKGAAIKNTVNLKNKSIVTGYVTGGYASKEGGAGNEVNVDSFVRVDGSVYGLIITSYVNQPNVLNIHGISNEFGGIANFQNINIDILDKDCKMLSVNDAIDLGRFATFNAVNSKNYKTGTTLTLLYSDKTDFTKLSKDKLRIDGQAIEEITVDRSGFGDIKDIKVIDVVAGFEVLHNAINFSTQYKLNDTLNVAQPIQLNNGLQLNGQTINMQQPKDAAANDVRYDLLTVKNLTGEGNLAIDVDFAGGKDNIKNDKISISSDGGNNAVINLNSVIFRKDLPSTLTGIQEEKGVISVVEGNNLNGITLKGDPFKVATSDYIYIFTPGEAGKLNFTQMLPGTLADYIQDKGKFEGVNTFTQTINEISESNLGTTYRKNGDKNITLKFNKGISLSGDEKKYTGAVVADGYTLKLQGEDKTNPGKVTQFKTAAVTVNAGGALEVTNMKFEGNDKDIVNNGTLTLYGGNTITSITGTGTTNIEAGFNIPNRFEQSNVNVKKGVNLTFNNKAKVTGTLNNNGTVTMSGSNTLTSVSGTGRLNVYEGTTTVSGNFEQNYACVKKPYTLILNGVENNINTIDTLGYTKLTNAKSINKIETVRTNGTFFLNGSNTIGYIYNMDKLYLNGSNTIESINGRESLFPFSQITIQGGETTVTGALKSKMLTVDAGKLTLKGNSVVTGDLNIKSKGVLEIEDTFNLNQWSGIKNDGIVTMKSGNPFNFVEGRGIINIEQGKTTVNGGFKQKTLNVKAGELELKGETAISNTLINDSTISLNGSKNTIATLNNNGTANLQGTNAITTVKGDGTLNINAGNTTVTGAFAQKALNFTLPKDIKADGAMLNLKGATTDISLEEINTTVNKETYMPGTTVTLLTAENGIDITGATLKINGDAEKTAIKTAVDGLSGEVGTIVGYDVSPQAIKLATNSYKLLESTNVTKDITLNSALDLNGQALNLQSDSEEKDSYNTLTVKRLINSGKTANLAIDVDLAAGVNDKINITGEEENNATINLNSIIVRKDLPSKLSGIEEVTGKVSVIEGNTAGINLNLTDSAVKTATTNYIYTFAVGEAGRLNYTQALPGSFADFIPGTEKYKDVNSYTLTEDKVVEKGLGETNRDQATKPNDKIITLAFNADKKLSGDNKAYEGTIVADTYTLKLQGVDEATPGVMTQFKTAAVTNNGVLEVENMRFVDNDQDIVNNKTLKLNGGNTINDIANEGTAELEGKNSITTVSGAGSFNVEAGETTVSGALTQNAVVVQGGKLALKGNADIASLKVDAAGAMEVDAALKLADGCINNGTVTVNSDNTLSSVTSNVENTGSFNVAAGKTVVENGLTQAKVKVEKEAELNIEGTAIITDTLDNAGTVSLKGSENEINVLTNEGTANLEGSNTVTTLNNNGTASLKGTNNITTLTNTATVNLEGSNTVTTLNNNGTASLKGTNNITTLTNTATANLEGSNNVTTMHNNGIAKLNGADNKIATVVGNGTFNVNEGTTTVNGAFVQKTVNVSGGELVLNAPSESFLAGEVQGHAVNITGGKVTGHVYGGASTEAAHENNVTIDGNAENEYTVKGDVYGGISYNGNAYKNTVNISGGNITGDVYGALTIDNGTAYANTVNISGGTIEGNVYGGINEYGSNSGHYNNVINISGGEVKGTIYGASNKVEANNLLHVSASNDKAIQAGNIAYLQKLEFTMPQGYDRNKALLTLTGTGATSLNLSGDGSVVLNSSPEDRLVTGERVTLIKKDNDQTLALMDNGNAIFDDNGTMKAAYNKIALYQASPLYILKGKLELAALDGGKANDLIFVAGKNILDRDDEEVKPEPKPTPVEPDPDDRPKPEPKPDPKPIVPPSGDDEPKPIIPVDPEPQPDPGPDPKPDVDPEPQPTPDPIDYDKVYSELMDNVKTAMETRANGAALVNEAGDFLMKQGLSNAKMAAEANKAEGDSSMAPFVALGGGKLRYETGSHVDSKSWHGAVGLAKQVNGLTFGVAIQQGKSNYDAYVNKAHSEGNSKSVGGALFAEKKIANGLHFDAAVRAGRVKNDYSANVTYSIPGENAFNVRYNESSAFYGISLGGGKEFTLKNKDKVDVYGRYAWTHTGSSEATTNWKDELKFDGINSHRILLGSRYTHSVNERNELYAGLGWQYELGGKVKGSIYGYSVPEPSLKGSSGLLELGWKAAAEENMTVDLNLSGWTGKLRGVMAGVNMQWKF